MFFLSDVLHFYFNLTTSHDLHKLTYFHFVDQGELFNLARNTKLLSISNDSRLLLMLWFILLSIFSYLVYPVFLQNGGDFYLYHSIGELFQSNSWQHMYMSAEQGPYYAYSPIVAPFFWPLGVLPIDIAQQVFVILKFVTYFFWPILIADILHATQLGEFKRILIGILSSMSIMPSIYEETWAGNINLFCITGLLAAVVQLNKSRIFSSSVILSFIAAIKPQYGLFLFPAFFTNFKQASIGSIVTLLSLLGLSLSIYGTSGLVELTTQWIKIISVPIADARDINNISYSAWLERIFSSGPIQGYFPNLTDPLGKSLILTSKFMLVTLSLISMLLISRTYYSKKMSLHDWTISIFGLLSLLTLILTPVIWITHQMLLVFASILILTLALRIRSLALSFIFFLIPLSLYFSADLLQRSVELRNYARTYGLSVISTCTTLIVLSLVVLIKSKNLSAATLHLER